MRRSIIIAGGLVTLVVCLPGLVPAHVARLASAWSSTGSLIEHDSSIAVRQPGPHDGGGTTTAYPFFAKAPALGMGFRKRALHPGAAIGYHRQESDEIYYVLSGRGELTLDGARREVGPGTAILTRPGSSHGLRQVGREDLVILVAYPLPPAPAAEQPAAGPNRLTDAERAAGWRLLFDGATLRGWRGLGRDTVPTVHWTVEDGAIKKIPSAQVPLAPDGQPLAGGDLMTEATYGDFELAWEWKVSPGGNSGIKYNVSEQLSTTVEPRHAAIGFEYQVLDDERHPDGELESHRAGALYDLLAPNDRKRLRPVGEWNQSRIVFRGTHGEHWLNGEKIVEYELGTPRMTAALAASKYHPISWFAERRRGHIVLQDHGDAVWFRSLKIRALDGTPR